MQSLHVSSEYHAKQAVHFSGRLWLVVRANVVAGRLDLVVRVGLVLVLQLGDLVSPWLSAGSFPWVPKGIAWRLTPCLGYPSNPCLTSHRPDLRRLRLRLR